MMAGEDVRPTREKEEDASVCNTPGWLLLYVHHDLHFQCKTVLWTSWQFEDLNILTL